MFYYIYKITNVNTGQFYVGSHATNLIDDNYFGSGMYLKRAIKKHGKSNFKKEIIKMCNSYEDMILSENYELQKIKHDKVYNLKFCAMGGNTRIKYTEKEKEIYIQKLKDNPNSPIGKKGSQNHMYGKRHTLDYKKIRSAQQKTYFKELKQNNPDKYNEWRNKRLPHAIKNCINNAAKKRKPIKGFSKITGEAFNFNSVTDCMTKLKVGRYRLNLMLEGKDVNIALEFV